MPLLSYSDSVIGGTVEDVAELNTMLADIREVVNGLDDDNIVDGANIQYDKLALGGALKLTDLESAFELPFEKLEHFSGPVSVSDAGVTGLRNYQQDQAGGVNLAIDETTYSAINGITPVAGTYLAWWKARIESGANQPSRTTAFLAHGFTIVDYSFAHMRDSVFESRDSLVCMSKITVDGSTTIHAQATSLQTTGTGPLVQYGRLLLLGVA